MPNYSIEKRCIDNEDARTFLKDKWAEHRQWSWHYNLMATCLNEALKHTVDFGFWEYRLKRVDKRTVIG